MNAQAMQWLESLDGAHQPDASRLVTCCLCPKILRRKAVETRTGLSRSTLYDYVRAGTFPRPVRLGARAVGWLESDLERWLAERVERSRTSAQGRPMEKKTNTLAVVNREANSAAIEHDSEHAGGPAAEFYSAEQCGTRVDACVQHAIAVVRQADKVKFHRRRLEQAYQTDRTLARAEEALFRPALQEFHRLTGGWP